MTRLSRRLSLSAFVGLVVWAALLFVPLQTDVALGDLTAHLLLLAPLVLVPLLLDAAVAAPLGEAPRLLVLASWLLLPGALAAAASFLLPVGAASGALAALWVAATAPVALWAVLRAVDDVRAGRLVASEAVLLAGLAALPGGAVWLTLARAGVDPGPYGALVVLLTAAHFHYAAFAAPVWAGLLGRALAVGPPLARRLNGVFAVGLVIGFWLVAVGIALNRGPSGLGLLETAGVVVLTLSAAGTGVLGLVAAPRLGDRWGGVMLAVSGGSLALAMGLALWFNVGHRLGVGSPSVAWMVPRHGWLNAVGFGLWGALGWRRLRPRPVGR